MIRHGKSSWEDPSLDDHDRPLLPTGIKKTRRIADFLAGKKIQPGLILSSSAVRAFETAVIIAPATGYPVEKIKKSKALYHASADQVFDEIFSIDNSIDTVLLFGHNPTFTYFVNRFVDPPLENLPTSGAVSLVYDCDKWENISGSAFKVNFVVFPRMLKK